jgi:hypothetical protein
MARLDAEAADRSKEFSELMNGGKDKGDKKEAKEGDKAPAKAQKEESLI